MISIGDFVYVSYREGYKYLVEIAKIDYEGKLVIYGRYANSNNLNSVCDDVRAIFNDFYKIEKTADRFVNTVSFMSLKAGEKFKTGTDGRIYTKVDSKENCHFINEHLFLFTATPSMLVTKVYE